MIHFLIHCHKVKEIWSFWLNWWEKISGILIKHSTVLTECIMFGFLTNKDEIFVINYCILHTKYYIYIQRLFNQNSMDIHSCQVQLKHRLEIEHIICKQENREDKFDKYRFIYDNL